uniref:CUE domain-containing protein n=1 Tax=Cacopsylla melanoneura TaxID=428564 RepID=A0A8D8UPE1_9HEMI
MAGCHCSNIEIMQLFHELKQKFPVVPDHIVTQCIHQNGHNKDLCENELEEENSRYLTHCFPQGLVDKMNTPSPSSPLPSDEAQVYLERGYIRRSLDSTQCSRRKSSSGSDDVPSVVGKHSSKVMKKLGLGLPPKNAKRLHKKHGADWTTLGGGKHSTSEMEIDDSSEKRHQRHTPIKVDHRGNPERYTMFDEITAKGKYKKLSNELDDITNVTNVASMPLRADVTNLGDVTMSVADQQKLCVAQQMLGLRECDETYESTSTGGKSASTTSTGKSASSSKSAANENRRTPRSQHLSPRRHKHYSRGESKVSPSRRTNSGGRKTYSTQHSVPAISLPSPSIDRKISSETRWNFQPSPTSPQPTLKQFNQPAASNTNQEVTATDNASLGVPTEHINLGHISPSIRFQGNVSPLQGNVNPNIQRNISSNIQEPSRGSKSKSRESLKLDLFSQNPQPAPVPNIQYQSCYHSNQALSSKQSAPSNQGFPGKQGVPNSKQSVSNNPFFPSNQAFLGSQGFPSNQASPGNQGVPSNQFRLSVPSSGNELTSVSVLSYSAPSTPMSCSSPLFPPLAVDVNTGGHRTSLSLEPLPHYGLSEDPARPLTKVTLSLRPPGDDTEALSIPNNATSGLTYTSFSLKDGVQAHQLHISIGPTGPQQVNSNMNTLGRQGANHCIDSSVSSSNEPHGLPQHISDVTKSILIAQKERKAKLMTALMCEKDRLNAIKRNILSIEEKMRLMASLQKVPSRSPRISKLRLEIKTLQEECLRMTKAVDSSSDNPDRFSVHLGDTDEEFYSQIYTGQKIAVPSSSNSSRPSHAADQIYHRNLHIEVTHDTYPARSVVHSWVV